MAKETVAILGGKGMLGTDLTETCRQENFEVKIFDLPEFDITNLKHLEQAVNSAQTIVNCAAYTNVDGAEKESKLAHRINAEAAGRLGTLTKKANRWLLHISTDFIFDGKLNRPYVETDLPNPLNEYGRSKLDGEQLLIESGCRHCIMRMVCTAIIS
jgi:dTDP-4-dehydrorhamnose reductase